MARISRVTQKIFAGSATNNGVFGSAQDGTKVLSTSLATLMSKPAWLTGWLDAVMGASKFPPLEEMQSVNYVHSTQIAYLLQQGIAEYDSGTTYYTNNVVMKSGSYQLYGSKTNANVGNALTDTVNWELIADFTSPSFSTGDVKMTIKTTADTGWILCNDGTIGNAASGATTRANADTVDLFTLLWNNVSNAYAAVSGGRGASAAADYAANKTIALTKMLGRTLAIAGAGSGLTSRALGLTIGEESHTPTLAEMFAHTHVATVTDAGHRHKLYSSDGALNASTVAGLANAGSWQVAAGTNNGGTLGFSDVSSVGGNPWVETKTTGITVANDTKGSSTAFNVMQPTSFLNVMIKL